MDLLYNVLQTHSLVDSKNLEIINLQKQMLENAVEKCGSKCDSRCSQNSGPKKCENIVLQNIPPIQNPGKDNSGAINSGTESLETVPFNLNKTNYIWREPSPPTSTGVDFNPSTHDWDNGEWVTVTPRKNDNKIKALSFSDVIKKPVRELHQPKISIGVNQVKGSSESRVLLLEPTKKGEKMQQNSFLEKRSKIKSLVNEENKNIRIDNISRTKTGGILMAFPSFKDLENTKNILDRASPEINLSPKLPTKVLPKIEISNIDYAIPENQIINVLLEKNPAIRSIMDETNSVFELVFTKKDFNSSSQKAIIKCTPNVRSAIMQNGCIFIDCDRCPCKDHLFIFQCQHCASYGHSATRCTKKNREDLVCLLCAEKGDHTSDRCPSRSNHNVHACTNCLASNEPDIREDGILHAANSKQCPIYLRELSKLALRTDYGTDAVYF